MTHTRETHIKEIPIPCLGGGLVEKAQLPQDVGPEFSVEPTPTVYLRYARAYRFLGNALTDIFGESFLKDLRSPWGTEECNLTDMTSFCYGLYQQLCFEVGQEPLYDHGELSKESALMAQHRCMIVLKTIRKDPVMALDSRVSVPAATLPDGTLINWANIGVTLEKVRYEYRDLPKTSLAKPNFVPIHYYLPTEVFIEFKGDIMERKEFREF